MRVYHALCLMPDTKPGLAWEKYFVESSAPGVNCR
jgi:hypothetical protein